MPRDESRKVKTDMLDALAFCDNYGLRYYLPDGDFLTAVHHKWFIPFDDDIDTNMPDNFLKNYII